MQQTIRPPAVAGLFYPASPDELSRQVDALLRDAAEQAEGTEAALRALIVPHAGYIYSGPTAAAAYFRLPGSNIRHVVLLGPVHRVPVRGMALPEANGFATPLGVVPLDTAGMQKILPLPQVVTFDPAHQQEHSLEVQLPFLQRLLGEFTLLPLAVGDASAEEVAEVLDILRKEDDTLILVSSDLSHFHPYIEAQAIDAATVQAVLQLKGPISHQQACGATPVNGLLHLARTHALEPSLLDLRNSGDTAGDKGRVVGYGAFAFSGEYNG